MFLGFKKIVGFLGFEACPGVGLGVDGFVNIRFSCCLGKFS